MNMRMFDGGFSAGKLPHELLLTTRQKMKLRNAFEDIESANIMLSKAQISKITQSGGFLGVLLSKIGVTLIKVATSLAKKMYYHHKEWW